MRIVFMGTPNFAVPVLDALMNAGHEIAAVVSQPDREKDKKGNLLPTPVKKFAVERSLNVLQCARISDCVGQLAELRPDVMITAAFGQLLRPDVLTVAPHGILNVHASLLPAYRGASPVQSALLAGETQTGVTIMRTDIGMDTGDMLSHVVVPISENDTAQTLSDTLAEEGAKLLVQTLYKLENGGIDAVPQDGSKATYCKKIGKADGLVDWNLSAREIACRVRAFNPWPSAYTYLDGSLLKIHAATAAEGDFGSAGSMI
ncbi:MAG: methionyl-tRNA formyltransferase, partial [Clostridiales bacterium]|nr:methionyl-tRNA formyltransferase [Clostridiales bacterium]